MTSAPAKRERRVMACLLALVAGCSAPIQLTATALQPAGLPLRSFPHVFIVGGQLPQERRIARGLAAHLERNGHVSAPVVAETALRQRLASTPLPVGSVIVELALSLREMAYRQSAPTRTVCDTLSCYVLPASTQEMPVLQARLELTVRDGASLAVRQRVAVKALEAAANPRQLEREVTLTLIERLRVLVDQRRLVVSVDLVAPDLPGVGAAVDAAEDGDWQAARQQLQAIATRSSGADPATRAGLLHDLAQAHRFADEASEPQALKRALALMREAGVLQPGNRRYQRGVATLARDLQNAQMLQRQRVTAAHNFALEKTLRSTASGPRSANDRPVGGRQSRESPR